MMPLNILRSIVAVIGGVLLLGFMDATLERTLVSALAQGVPASEVEYVAVRNQPVVLAITLVTHVLAATLVGYIIAKIAGVHEVRHAVLTGALLIVAYASTFITVNTLLPPAWVRIAMLIATPPALAAGAHIRAEARAIHAERAGEPRPQEERR